MESEERTSDAYSYAVNMQLDVDAAVVTSFVLHHRVSGQARFSGSECKKY
jgi:hypothetical protein